VELQGLTFILENKIQDRGSKKEGVERSFQRSWGEHVSPPRFKERRKETDHTPPPKDDVSIRKKNRLICGKGVETEGGNFAMEEKTGRERSSETNKRDPPHDKVVRKAKTRL